MVVPAAGNYPVTVTISELRTVEKVLEVRVNTSPTTDGGTRTGEKLVGVGHNVVGYTLIGVGRGTTLNIETTVLGF